MEDCSDHAASTRQCHSSGLIGGRLGLAQVGQPTGWAGPTARCPLHARPGSRAPTRETFKTDAIAREADVFPIEFTAPICREEIRRPRALMNRCGWSDAYVLANVVRVEHILAVKNDVFPFDGADMLQETDVDIFAFRNAHFQNAGDFLGLPIDDTGQQ